MAQPSAIKVAILWHMHQPNYREPHGDRLAMPWVRLHALKDYLDMPLMASAGERVRVTFNLVPSLIDQLDLYLNGGSDKHLELSRLPADQLSTERKLEMLQTFFCANPRHMIEPNPRFHELYQKYLSGESSRRTVASLFSTSEYRDLQVWSNLAWIDPLFRNEEPIKSFFEAARNFSEEDKQRLFAWQKELIARIMPTYRQLQDDGRIEISFTPYYHPILPLLCDTASAREALPSIALPKKAFVHPEDAREQINRSVAKYQELLGRPLRGMWPSEGSVSEEALALMGEAGITWAASDQDVLLHSLNKSSLPAGDDWLHRPYRHGENMTLFFRDRVLSDKIGFVYANWDADRAVADFVGHLKSLREQYHHCLDEMVVPVILDGENAWEYFPDDGAEFLTLLYDTLERDESIATVTMSEAAGSAPALELPRVFAGSWINHNFKIWIGHAEDNAAWDLLSETRSRLVDFERENPNFDPEKLASAWKQIYIAEGSDWCWWYGDDHLGEHNDLFDQIYRRHLSAVYDHLGLDVPFSLLQPIRSRAVKSPLVEPEGLITPIIDGRISQFYEWAGAGYYDCLQLGAAMHRTEQLIRRIHFGYDRDRVYIRLDFGLRNPVELIPELRVTVLLQGEEELIIEATPGLIGRGNLADERFSWSIGEVFELGADRATLWPSGAGQLSVSVRLVDADRLLEAWPDGEPIRIDVPERNQEIFWPT